MRPKSMNNAPERRWPAPIPGARGPRAVSACRRCAAAAPIARAAPRRWRGRDVGILTIALSLGVARVAPVQSAVALPPGFADYVVTTGLDRPTGLAFLPDGRALVAEQ